MYFQVPRARVQLINKEWILNLQPPERAQGCHILLKRHLQSFVWRKIKTSPRKRGTSQTCELEMNLHGEAKPCLAGIVTACSSEFCSELLQNSKVFNWEDCAARSFMRARDSHNITSPPRPSAQWNGELFISQAVVRTSALTFIGPCCAPSLEMANIHILKMTSKFNLGIIFKMGHTVKRKSLVFCLL